MPRKKKVFRFDANDECNSPKTIAPVCLNLLKLKPVLHTSMPRKIHRPLTVSRPPAHSLRVINSNPTQPRSRIKLLLLRSGVILSRQTTSLVQLSGADASSISAIRLFSLLVCLICYMQYVEYVTLALNLAHQY